METDSSLSPEKPQRVLLFSSQLDWGGGEEQLQLLAEGLARRGWHVLTVAPRHSRLVGSLKKAGQPVEGLSNRGRGPAAWWQLRRVLRTFRPHVLWMNDPHAILHGLIASLGLRIVRVGARRTVFPLRSGRIYHWGLDCVVCVSRAAAVACREAGISSSQIAIIFDGVNPARITRASRERGRHKLAEIMGISRECRSARFIVHVGKLTPAKGQEDLVQAFAMVAPSACDSFLVLVGDGELRSDLTAKICSLGLTGRVVLAGFRKDALDFVAGADLFVFPSRQEGLGGALMEALCLGVPVIASTAGGIPELFEMSEEGASVVRLFPPGDVEALRGALDEALKLDAQERRQWGERARLYAQEHLTADRMILQTSKLFEQLLAKKCYSAARSAR